MLSALFLSLRQWRDPAIVRVWLGSLALTLLLFAGAGYGLYRWLGAAEGCVTLLSRALCLRDLSGMGALVGALAALWLLFPAVAIGVMGVFADSVVLAVERRHYPAAAAAGRSPGWGRSAAMGLRSAARLIGYNLLALPCYLLLIVTGIGPLILAVAVNAIALGRDLWEMVAVRHMPPVALAGELGETRGVRAGIGLVAAVLFVVPGINLIVPLLGAAMATHLYHRRRG